MKLKQSKKYSVTKNYQTCTKLLTQQYFYDGIRSATESINSLVRSLICQSFRGPSAERSWYAAEYRHLVNAV